MSGMNSKANLLIVDDEAGVRSAIASILKPFHLNIREAENGVSALDLMKREPSDIVFLDINMPSMKGTEVLIRLRESYPETQVIMITGFPSVESATECIKNGAVDYLVKPFRKETLVEVVSNAMEKVNELKKNGVLRKPETKDPLDKIIGNSPAVQELKSKIKRVARTDSTVLITGESGTGKDLFARAIHEISPRARNDFVPVDCSVLVESLVESELFGYVKGAFTGADGNKAGLFEIANQGTFFFDEVSNLSYNIQCKLLRVIQEREFRKVGSQQPQKLDIRILCASNRDLIKAVEKGTFRNDLYYRINVVPIHLPPLRERSEDIPLLLEHFLKQYNVTCNREVRGFSDEAVDMLISYPWPGNVRELQHLVEQIL
ncbi:MAG: sigma-54 dependent transcriptional regulator, partial [Desulfobacterales bacterium]|nr:sigma-54 dependent transcriptional regulator [Desulfobacterales bacterium]